MIYIINDIYCIMRTVLRVLRNIKFGTDVKPLGRWGIDTSNTIRNQKIDLANEDHCGSCGEYIVSKLPVLNKPDTEVFAPVKKLKA
tara:strand:+ start:49 stop:306 length:258 start_codon:yes stop_codon:yes gene_type:complete